MVLFVMLTTELFAHFLESEIKFGTCIKEAPALEKFKGLILNKFLKYIIFHLNKS